MAFGVLDAVDRLVARLTETRELDGFYHPSGIFGCPRKALYELRGTPKSNPPDERALRIFRVGHMYHEFVQRALLESPDVVAVFIEIKVVDMARGIKGAADALVLLADGGWKVVEIKSMNSMSMRYKDLPTWEHTAQAATYLLTLRDYGAKEASMVLHDGTVTVVDLPPLKNIESVRIAYVSKDNMEVQEYDIKVGELLETQISDRLKLLDRHRVRGTLPKRLPLVVSRVKADNGKLVKDKACTYCPFNTTCWNGRPDEGIDL